MELFQHRLQLLRDRETKVRCILYQGDAFIGEIEENDRRAKDAAGTDDLRIQHVADAHQREDQDLAADTLEADLAGELVAVR